MSLTKLYLALKKSLEELASPNPTSEQPLAFGTNRVQLFNQQTEKGSLQANAIASGTLPAAFIQIKEAEFMHLKNNVQRRTLKFCIHISSLVYDNNGNVMNDGAKATEFYDLVEAVHCQINGGYVEDENNHVIFTPFVRTEEKQFIDEDGGEDDADSAFDQVQTHIITYETVQTVINARKPSNTQTATIRTVTIDEIGENSDELEIIGNRVENANSPEETTPEEGRRVIINPTDFPTT